MRYLRVIICALLLTIISAPVMVALASDISDALFYGIVRVTNNSTATANVATVATINTTNLINSGYINATANNCVMRSSSGADVPFMPGYTPDDKPWAMWVPSIGANSLLSYILYTANSTGGEFRYFPDDGGMTTPDDASIELSDNFIVEQKGWLDTVADATKNLLRKVMAFRIWVSDTSEISATIGEIYLSFVRANSDWVSIPDSPALDFTDGAGNDEPGTWIAWVKLDTTANGMILCKYDTVVANQESWSLQTLAGNTVRMAFYKDDGTERIGRITNTILPLQGTWIHIATTYDGSETSAGINIYINGVDADVANSEALPYNGMADTTTVVEIGSQNVGVATFMDGDMAYAKIYTAELTPAQILADFDGDHLATNLEAWYELDDGVGNPTDSSGNGHNATANLADWAGTSATVTATGVASGERTVTVTSKADALDFVRANSDRVGIPDAPAFSFTDGAGTDKPFTIIGWVNFDDATSSTIAAKYDSGTARREWHFRTEAADKLEIAVFHLNDGAIKRGRLSNAITAYEGQWIRVGATYDGSETNAGFNIYLNGVDADTADNTGGAYTGMTNTTVVEELGSRDIGTVTFLDGLLSEVIFYDVELTPAEMLADYNGTHKDSDLIAWYQLDEGAGLPTDSSGNGHDATANLADWVSTGPLKIFIDDVLEDVNSGAAVPDNANNWEAVENGSMLYMESHEIIIGGTQAQFIEWEYDATFEDQSANTNDATPTFRGTSSDADVSATMVSFLPIAEAKAPDYALGVAPPFIDADALTGNVTAPFTTTPTTGTFPLAEVIRAVADATGTPGQLPLLIIAGFIILAASLSISTIMRRYGSGTLTVKIVTIIAFMGIFIALQNFGMDFWMLCVFLVISIALAMGSRQLGWT